MDPWRARISSVFGAGLWHPVIGANSATRYNMQNGGLTRFAATDQVMIHGIHVGRDSGGTNPQILITDPTFTTTLLALDGSDGDGEVNLRCPFIVPGGFGIFTTGATSLFQVSWSIIR